MAGPRERRPLRTVLVGFGRIAAGLAGDERMARFFRYATHAQVLVSHPDFHWDAVVDPDSSALESAGRNWGISNLHEKIEDLSEPESYGAAVLACPPGGRGAVLGHLPSLRALVVEKPLGTNMANARAFAKLCDERGILAQVNLWRRADELTGRLAGGLLEESIGEVRAATAVYGNGIRNNGVHLIDLIRLLLGEIVSARALGPAEASKSLPLPNDRQVAFALNLQGGAIATVHPIDFADYREVGLDLWGRRGRLEIALEGLSVRLHPRRSNRALEDAREVAPDIFEEMTPTIGCALYRLYDNLAEAARGTGSLCSPASSALHTEKIVEAVLDSAASSGALVPIV